MMSTNFDYEALKAENEMLKSENKRLKEENYNLNWDKIGLKETIENRYIEHLNLEKVNEDNSYAWKKILEELPMGVFINGPQGVMWVNKAVESMLGYSREEFLKFSNEKIQSITKLEDITDYYKAADYFGKNPNGKYQIIEYQMKKKDGEYTWMLSVHFPYIIKDGVCLSNIGCAIDISNRKELELELIEAKGNLEVSQKKEKELMLKNQHMIQRQVEILKGELEQFSVKHLELIEFTEDILHLSKELEKKLEGDAKQTLIEMKSKYTEKVRRDKIAGQFEDIFTRIDPNFYKHLMCKHPEISYTELKICALIKLQINTRQISELLNLSRRTVEFHIYNVRKKLGLKRPQRLETYLIEL